MNGFKNIEPDHVIAMGIDSPFEWTLCSGKAIHIYTWAINIMELLTDLQQQHASGYLFFLIFHGILANNINW